VIAATGLVNRVDEDAHALRIRVLRNAVTEVENVTATLTVSGEHALSFTAYALRRPEEHSGIEVPL
jgi:hypothetical protein